MRNGSLKRRRRGADDRNSAAGFASAPSQSPAPLWTTVGSSRSIFRDRSFRLTVLLFSRGRQAPEPVAAAVVAERRSEPAAAAVPALGRIPPGALREARGLPPPRYATACGGPFFRCLTSVSSTVDRSLPYDNRKVIDSASNGEAVTEFPRHCKKTDFGHVTHAYPDRRSTLVAR